MRGDVAQETKGICLAATLATFTGEAQDPSRRDVRILESVGEPAGLAQMCDRKRMERDHPRGLEIRAGLPHQCEAFRNTLRQREYIAQLSCDGG